MRIITGDLRGRVLPFLKEKGVRPTSSKTREALFNILGSVEGFNVLDLYSGTGSIGFEAISRGARQVAMIDISSKLLQAIKETAKKWKISEKVICLRNDVLRFAMQTLQSPEKYDLIFADPPFGEKYPDLRIFLPRLNEDGFAVFEMPSRNMPKWANEAVKVRNYGESSLAVFHKGIPFPIVLENQENIPNNETLEAFKWTENHIKSGRKKGFKTTKELYKTWGLDA